VHVTVSQALAFALMAGAVVMFIWGRFRYDLVALAALLLSVLVGVVPAKEAFSGFSNDIVVIIASALVISAAVSRSGAMEAILRPLLARVTRTQGQVVVLVAATTLLSMVTKNVGALAILMPIALQMARATGTNASALLMPMSFGALLGGLVTLVGTSPNIIVSQVRAEILGKPFAMFDYAPVGLSLAAVGVLFLSFGWRLLPKDRHTAVQMSEAIQVDDYVTEARVPLDWGRRASLADLHALTDSEARVIGIVREGQGTITPLPDAEIHLGDTLLMRGEQKALETFVERAGLQLARANRPVAVEEAAEEIRVAETVVGLNSPLVGRTATQFDLFRRFGLNLLAVGRRGERIASRLGDIVLRPGDLLVLQGAENSLPTALQDIGCLPLVARDVRLGAARRSFLPLAVLAIAVCLVGFNLLPVAVAFFGAAVAVVALRSVSLRQAYDALDGPVLVLVAALIPVSDAVRATGGADLLAAALSGPMAQLPAVVAVAVTILAAMAATPFLNNAACVLLMAPIGAGVAKHLQLNPDPFLMAVAVGAACDFLTPIGHQCNTLVLGPGGYRFGDYWRLGLPLSVAVVVVGAPMICLVWPVVGR
jgi:di/tricarboxylate transporter